MVYIHNWVEYITKKCVPIAVSTLVSYFMKGEVLVNMGMRRNLSLQLQEQPMRDSHIDHMLYKTMNESLW